MKVSMWPLTLFFGILIGWFTFPFIFIWVAEETKQPVLHTHSQGVDIHIEREAVQSRTQ